jgi:AcrR family transcriptional regulator
MSVSSQGRSAQRSRTRRDLVTAARALLAQGRVPTVTATADAADVSRATAYRYFPNNDTLLVEAGLHAAIEPGLADTAPGSPNEVPEAVATLVGQVNDWVRQHEAEMRVFMRLSLTTEAGGIVPKFQRPASRLQFLATALRPLDAHLPPATIVRLRNALALLMGIDPVITLTDVCRISETEARQVLTWTARTLVTAALADPLPR